MSKNRGSDKVYVRILDFTDEQLEKIRKRNKLGSNEYRWPF